MPSLPRRCSPLPCPFCGFCASALRGRFCPSAGCCGSSPGQFHRAAFAQTIRAAGDDGFADFQAIGDRDFFAFGRTGLDVAHLHRVIVLHDIHEHSGRTALECGRRNHDRVFHHVEQQTHVDELVRKQAFVRVDEFGLRLHGSGRGIDLIVETRQRTARELGGRGAVVRIDLQRVARVHLLQHGGRLSSGIVNSTSIGLSCVMTTMPPPTLTLLPGST